MHVPIIKLEVAGMKHAMQVALAEHSALMDNYVQEAVERYCQEDNIRKIVLEHATSALDYAVKKAINDFFRYGKGREQVKEAVNKELSRWNDDERD